MKWTINDFFKPSRPYGTITESVMDKCSKQEYQCLPCKAKKKNMCVYGHPTYPNFC